MKSPCVIYLGASGLPWAPLYLVTLSLNQCAISPLQASQRWPKAPADLTKKCAQIFTHMQPHFIPPWGGMVARETSPIPTKF
jgi:hypothetical protein